MRGLLLLGFLVVAPSPPADACSAPVCWPGAFVPGDGATIPANAPGLYWRPMAGQDQPDPSQVRLTRASDPLTPLDFASTQLPNGDYVLAPAAPLIEGEQYVLEDRSTCSGTAGPRVTFTAGAQAPLPASLGTLQLIGHGTPLELDVSTASGSCSTTVDAMTLSIELVRSADAEPWKDLFLYETLVDDQPWTR